MNINSLKCCNSEGSQRLFSLPETETPSEGRTHELEGITAVLRNVMHGGLADLFADLGPVLVVARARVLVGSELIGPLDGVGFVCILLEGS